MKNLRRLLVLAPHTDDAELGAGGSIARFLDEGVEVHVAVFSTAEASLPPGSEPLRLRDEFLEAMSILGVPRDHLVIHDYEVRKLSYQRQEVLENLVELRRRLRPDAVFVPAGSDMHQDHQVLHAEGLRAFREITLWGYELPWNHVTFDSHAFVALERRHLDRKLEALTAYRSQLEMERPYFSHDFLEGLAKVRGTQVKVAWAEAFEVYRVCV